MSPNRKLCTLEQLLAVRAQARRHGRVVVHAHGCFDIVHPGHISYLQFARSQGDELIVSVSADPAVNKGLNRPLIPDDLRAASLAALECVDHVYINNDPTAVELLNQLQPDIYIKGREYEHNHDPRFLAERQAVITHGGRVVFSSGDVIYSSSALIGALEDTQPFTQEKIRRFCQNYRVKTGDLLKTIDCFRGRKAMVIGDYLLDRYHHCDATGIASESPMMSLRALSSTDYDGGAAVVASHLAGLGARPVLVTALADDALSRDATARLEARGVRVDALATRRTLAIKHRYLVDQQKLFKVDEGGAMPLDSTAQKHLSQRILELADQCDLVIFCDFGYGLITAGLLENIMPALRASVPIIAADVSGMQSSLLRFSNVNLMCPTEREVRQAFNDFSSGLTAVVCKLLHVTQAQQALITLGKQGLIAFDNLRPTDIDGPWERKLDGAYLPSLAGMVVDPLGCGDALLATASLTLAAGGSLHTAAYLGSLAASLQAGTLGNKAITSDQLLTRLLSYSQQADDELPRRLAS
ncbi:MAG: adenylyltransferase/cytidyltransferase family protein [Phycisphaerales bacterium]|nr:adenylyltransferase/cytidyltransferase family protein [Phycisphaerales bacterium]